MKSKAVLLLLILFVLPSVFALFAEGFFLSDDGEWMVIRFSAFHQALADGQFPVRWLGRLNHEYGYPVANFLYPGFMYLGVPIHLVGFSFVDTVKIILGFSMIGSTLFTFLWLRFRFGIRQSFIGALVYLYTPYHLFDLYKRGSVGEVFSLAVVPFIFWQIERKSIVLTSVGIAGLILAHNTLALLFLPIVIIYMWLRKLFTIHSQLLIVTLGLALSAFFWIPAIHDLQFTRFFQTQVSNWKDYFVNFDLVGLASFLVVLTALILIVRKGVKDPVIWLFLLVSAISIFLSSSVSSPIWQTLPVSFVQFPFRFLSVLLLCLAFLSSFILSKMKSSLFAIILLIILAISTSSYIKPSITFNKDDGFYATNMDTTTVQNEYMPKWVKALPKERASQKVEMVEGVGKVENVVAKSNHVTFTIVMSQAGIVQVNVVYFPGWDAFIDGAKTIIEYENERGVMRVAAPQGEHAISLRFRETPVRLAADLLSLTGLVFLGIAVVRKRAI